MMRDFFLLVLISTTIQTSKTAPLIETDYCIDKVGDVVFALDTSGSIWEEDFLQQLTFVEKVVEQFDIGADKVRVGLITFGSKVHHQFYLKDYDNKEKLIPAILNVKYVGGGTNTGSAIAHARNVMFKTINGGRDYAEKILIVITDGFSRNTTQAALEASICRNLGIKMFSVGVGFGVDDFELNAIADRPKDDTEQFCYKVDDFKGLEAILAAFTGNVCRAMSAAEKQNDHPGNFGHVEMDARNFCGGKPADIYFILDASSSIMEHNFRKMLNFVIDMLDVFDIGPDKTRIGVVLFSDGINPLILVDNDYKRSELKRRIANAPYLEGGTQTGSTLQYIRKRGFGIEHARRHVAHVAILLTDGQSEDMEKTMREARLSHKQGIYLFAIGIGDQIDNQELRTVASSPSEDFMFEIDDFDALSSVRSVLAIEACNAQDLQQDEKTMNAQDLQQNERTMNGCNLRKLDVIFVYESVTLGLKKANAIKGFISNMVEYTSNIDNDWIRFGTLSQSCSHDNVPLVSHEMANELLLRSEASQSKGLSELLRKLRHHGYGVKNGGRYGAQNVAIIFVDGKLRDYSEIQLEAKRVKYRNRTEIFVIVIGVKDFDPELVPVCSEPMSEHLFFVSDFNELTEITPLFASKFC